MQLSKYKLFLILIVASAISMASSCKKTEPVEDPVTTGSLNMSFDFYFDNNPIIFDSMMYVNAAGNEYMVYEVRYFISKVTIYKAGVATVLNGWANEHLIHSKIPTTLNWPIVDKIEAGNYDSISFTLGFTDADNIPYMFVNPPETEMVWPEYLGGGYHYLKIEGKWKAPNDYLRGSAFHLGRGQIYDAGGIITGFIDNSFRVSLPNSSFSITATNSTNVTLRMHIEQWFENPTVYDHNVYGGDIMSNQESMGIVRDNGWNVFELIK